MLRIRSLAGVMLVASLAVPAIAVAAVITTPYGVLDDATGLSWRKLGASSGLSFNMLGAQLAPGGSLAGYRLASGTEVGKLLNDRFAGVTGNVDWTSAFFDFATAIGATLRDGPSLNGTTLEFGGIVSGTGIAVAITPIDGNFVATGGPTVTNFTHQVFSAAGTGLNNLPGNTTTIAYPPQPYQLADGQLQGGI